MRVTNYFCVYDYDYISRRFHGSYSVQGLL